MKNSLIMTTVLASLAIFMIATAQTDPVDDNATAISDLRTTVANQGLRIDRLEHAGGQTPVHSSGSSEPSSEPTRTMVLVSINKIDHGGDHAEEIERLKRETTALMNTVNNASDDASYDAAQQVYVGHVRGGVRGWGRAAGGGYTTSNAGSIGRQVLADKQVENRYATLHAIKKEKLEALQRADHELRQIIMGHDGKTIISLETKHDLSKYLEDIGIGDSMTWSGTRVAADEDSESWKINSVKKVD